MEFENLFSEDDRQYLQMMQDNISRMAANSTNCKTWMVTLVTGIFALGCGLEDLKGLLLFVAIPVLVFWQLDTFYLELERKMRNRELDFILKAKESHTSKEYQQALYCFSPLKMENPSEEEEEKGFVKTNDRLFSKSIAPFYGWTMFIVITISVITFFIF